MATRTRQNWKPNNKGVYERQVGWKLSRNGRRVQHKFRFACALKEARRREQRIVELWEQIEVTTFGREPRWSETTIDIAKQISVGKSPIQIRKDADEDDVAYVRRVHDMRKKLPTFAILPELAYGHAFGLRMLEWMDNGEQSLPSLTEDRKQRVESLFDHIEGSSEQNGPTLHQAMNDYITWLEQEYHDTDHRVTAWGQTKIKQIKTLIDRHEDIPLAGMDYETVSGTLRFWRQRPDRKGSRKPIAKKSAEHYVAALKDFFRWLHLNPRYEWRKPEGFEEIRARVRTLEGEQRRQVTQEDVFTLDELVLLNQHATPLERVLLLLGINCGFGRAEIASLLVGEVYLRQPHGRRHQDALSFKGTSDDSFIKRVRRKTGVYGEHILFPQTVEAIEWALQRRRRLPGFDPNARLLLNGKGEPYDRATKSGNPNMQIPNRFGNLI